MTEHKIDAGLRALGVDPSTLDPGFLDALRNAGTTQTATLEDAYDRQLAEQDTERAARRAEADEQFARDVAASLGGVTYLAAPTDLTSGDAA